MLCFSVCRASFKHGGLIKQYIVLFWNILSCRVFGILCWKLGVLHTFIVHVCLWAKCRHWHREGVTLTNYLSSTAWTLSLLVMMYRDTILWCIWTTLRATIALPVSDKLAGPKLFSSGDSMVKITEPSGNCSRTHILSVPHPLLY